MGLSIGRTRLRIHPLALMFPVTACLLGARQDAMALMVGLLAHEGAHLLAARCLGVDVSQLQLMPIGGAIQMENPYALRPSRLLIVAAAGPLGNALAIVLGAALAHWGLLSPDSLMAFTRVNLALLLFNLLPALPLDGGRMLYAVLCPRVGPERAVNVGIWSGRAVALGLLGFAVWSALRLGRLNLSPVFAAVFMLASVPREREALSGVPARAMLDRLRPVHGPRPTRVWAVGADCEAREALRMARPDTLTLYAVYDGSRLSSITDDRRLLEAALERGIQTTVGEATARRPLPGRAS